MEATDITGNRPLFYATQRNFPLVVKFITDDAPAILAEIRRIAEEERKWREDHGVGEEDENDEY